MKLEPKSLLIGWGWADATPPKPVGITGQMHLRISERVNDPITVSALAVEAEGGSEQAVMVSCDLVTVPDELRDRVRQGLGELAPELDPMKVFISATHTHTGPELRRNKWPEIDADLFTVDETISLFVDRIVSAVTQAWESRQPGGVSWALGHAVIGLNRRWVDLDGTATMYRLQDQAEFSHIEGYENHTVNLLFTWDAEGALTGMVVNVACPSQVTEGESYLSADYWHEARTEIRRRLGEQIGILPQCAPAGDQSPHFLFRKAAEERMRELRGVTEREEIGLKLADAVERVLPLAQGDIRTEVPFAHRVEDIALTRRQVTEEEVADAERQRAEHLAEYEKLKAEGCTDVRKLTGHFGRARWFGLARERFEVQKTEPLFPMELHVLRLGDVSFATNAFELYMDYGTRIEVRSPAVQDFLVQLAGGGQYLPSERAVGGKGYGAVPMSTPVGPEGGQELVDATVQAIRDLWPQPKQV